ncbi:hypothetical protein MTIM_11900 [Mycobacterium timonense]|uniref:Uncharacterized protein n=1 Tax=Mycobacterium timonense TaxID=701043 RepID=A0A7I9Z2Y1_9MYCO|nr:hypothetical protein MTIM_11900 [Mycobacterium timonense]
MYWSSAGLRSQVAEATGAESTAPPSIEAPSAKPAAHADDTRMRERVRVLVMFEPPSAQEHDWLRRKPKLRMLQTTNREIYRRDG